MRILVIEDEPKVSAFIRQGLEESGHTVVQAFDGAMGKKIAQRDPFELIILDVLLPGINGQDLCRDLRRTHPSVPILMLSALGTTDDKVSGLDAGADDYLVKPFEFNELLARIRSITRRRSSAQDTAARIVFGDLELDLNRKMALRSGEKIPLTAKEFALLEYFMRNPDRVLSRAEISEHVWDIDFETGTNVVDVYVKLLRKKVDHDPAHRLIHTRVGLGYMLSQEG
ncbi:MAG: response regulator transcription factor [Flavobacteriales bacterium]|nr:response regulator transcription factor [Flavobacteriales bacterium]MCB9166264.1 response regulator transcription factor [Flavobacteriales bacterium]